MAPRSLDPRRVLVCTDVAGYGGMGNADVLDTQSRLVTLLADVYEAVGVDGITSVRPEAQQPGGDSSVDLLPPGIPEAKVVNGVVAESLALLRLANRHREPAGRLRVRMTIGQGTASVGRNGVTGTAVSRLCRIRDSDLAKEALGDADLVVLLDEEVYESSVDVGYHLDASRFRPVEIVGKPTDRTPTLAAHLYVPEGAAPSATPFPFGLRPDATGPL